MFSEDRSRGVRPTLSLDNLVILLLILPPFRNGLVSWRTCSGG